MRLFVALVAVDVHAAVTRNRGKTGVSARIGRYDIQNHVGDELGVDMDTYG